MALPIDPALPAIATLLATLMTSLSTAVQPPAGPLAQKEVWEEDLAITQAMNEVLEYKRTHRPKNTTRNYKPKQKEWTVS